MAAVRREQNRHGRIYTPFVWILPSLVLLVLFLFYPIFYTSILSFFKWNGFGPNAFREFVGLDNFMSLPQDRFMRIAAMNTFRFVLAMTTVEIGIAFFLAVAIFQAYFRGAAWLRGIIFFPCVLSAVVVGIVWRNIVFLRGGFIHQITTTLSLPDFYPLSKPDVAFYMIILVGMWQTIGFNLVIFFAGLQSVDNEVLESAQIDGANYWQLMLRVIAPILWPVFVVNIVLNVIGGVNVFDLAQTMGGPGWGVMKTSHYGDALATYMYFNSFGGSVAGGYRKFGYAASIAVVMMVVTLIFAAYRQRLRRVVDI